MNDDKIQQHAWTLLRSAELALAITALAACGPTLPIDDAGQGQSVTGSDGSTSGPFPGPGPVPSSSTTSTTTSTTLTTADPPPADGTSAGGADSTDDGISFIIDPDTPDLDLCSIFDQDCPPGEKCMPYAHDGGSTWNATRCSPIAANPGAPGDPCTVVDHPWSGEDDCDGTSMCWDVAPQTGQGYCVPFCIGSEENPSCADPCRHCAVSGDAFLALCLDSCDPLEQNCPEGQGCYQFWWGFVCALDSSGEAGMGEACEFVNSCPGGTTCIDSALVPGCESSAGCCSPYCTLDGVDPCPDLLPGTSCIPAFEDGEGPPEQCISAPIGVCTRL